MKKEVNVSASVSHRRRNDSSNVLPNIKCLFWVVIFSSYFASDHDDLLYCSNNRNNNPIKMMQIDVWAGGRDWVDP